MRANQNSCVANEGWKERSKRIDGSGLVFAELFKFLLLLFKLQNFNYYFSVRSSRKKIRQSLIRPFKNPKLWYLHHFGYDILIILKNIQGILQNI